MDEGKDDDTITWLPSSPVDCPFLKDPQPSALEASSHYQPLCDYCTKTRVYLLTGGEDVFFQGEPPWKKKRKNAETKEVHPETADKPMRKERKKDIERLPDGLVIKSYMNQGLSKEEAVRKLVSEKRERAKASKKDEDEAEKTKTGVEEMPYMPPVPFPQKTSVYKDMVDHQRYVAIASNFLHAIPTFRFETNKLELKSMDQKLMGEREEFQKMVLSKLEGRGKHPYNFANFGAVRFTLGRVNRRRMVLKGRYGLPAVLPVEQELGDADALSLNLKKVLHSGKLRRLIIPNEKRKFRFSLNAEIVSQRFPLEEVDKSPIAEDGVALSLALENDVGFIMGVSSALAIMCPPSFIDPSQFLLPISVKRVYSEFKGQATKVCIVGKPVLDGLLNNPSIWYHYVKYAAKQDLYPVETSAKTGGRQRMVYKKKELGPRANLPDVTKLLQDASSSDEERMVIAPAEEQQKENDDKDAKGNAEDEDETMANKDVSQPSTSTDDVVGDIMKQMGISGDELAASTSLIESSEMDSKHSKEAGGDFRKRYSVFSISEGTTNITDILIRSNNEGTDAEGIPIIVSNKIEYAGDFGAETLSTEWLLREILKCRLKGVQELLRFRIHNIHLYLLQKERANEHKLLEKIPDGKSLIGRCVQRLRTVTEHLQELEPGSYVLRYTKQAKFELHSQLADDLEKAIIDFDEPWNADVDKSLPPVREIFQGIDEHVVLVYHAIRKQIPAAFHCAFSKKGDGGTKRRGNVPEDVSKLSKSARRRLKRRVGRMKGKSS